MIIILVVILLFYKRYLIIIAKQAAKNKVNPPLNIIEVQLPTNKMGSTKIEENDIRSHFAKYGPINSVFFMRDYEEVLQAFLKAGQYSRYE